MRSRTMAGPQGHDAPYVPGWDCHGLPIELQVDTQPRHQEEGDDARSPSARDCRAYAEKFVAIQRTEFERLGILGEWADPYLTMAPAYQATIVRQLAEFVEKGLVYKAKKSVHWCISAAPRWPRPRSSTTRSTRSPSIDVRLALLRRRAPATLASAHPGAARPPRLRRHLDDDALDAARQPGPRLPSRRGLRVLSGRGDARRPAHRARRCARPRWRAGRSSPSRSATPLAEVKGSTFEGLRFRHPWIDRDSAGVLGDYVTLDTGTGVVHTAPGHGWDDYLTGVRYGLDIYCPVDEAGRFLPEVEQLRGPEGLRREPEGRRPPAREGRAASARARRRTPTRSAGAARTRSSSAPPSSGSSASTSAGFRERALEAIAQGALVPGLGRGAHPQHDRDPARLVHLAPAAVGRAHPRLLLQGLRRARCCTPELARRVADLFEEDSADAWYEREAKDLLPAGLRLPEVRRDASSRRRRTSSTCGSTPAPRTRPSWRSGRTCPGRPTSTSRAATSTAAGSTPRCSSAWARAGGRPTSRSSPTASRWTAQGRKISKSMGNDVDTQKLIRTYGAEILRLWVSMVDYREDMPLLGRDDQAGGRGLPQGPQHLPLPALEPLRLRPRAGHGGRGRTLEEIDRYALARHRQLVGRVLRGLRRLTSSTSSTTSSCSTARPTCRRSTWTCSRTASTATPRTARAGARRRPCCTGSRATSRASWRPSCPSPRTRSGDSIPGQEAESVHLRPLPAPWTGRPTTAQARWAALLDARAAVMKALEEARAAKRIASSLEARVEVAAPAAVLAPLRAYEAQSRVFPGNLANLFIVSDGGPRRRGRADLTVARGARLAARSASAAGPIRRTWASSPRTRRLRALRGGPGGLGR